MDAEFSSWNKILSVFIIVIIIVILSFSWVLFHLLSASYTLRFFLRLSQVEKLLPSFALFSFLLSEENPKGVGGLELMFSVAVATCGEIEVSWLTGDRWK